MVSYCNKCRYRFTNRNILELNICAGECPFCGTPLDDKPKPKVVAA